VVAVESRLTKADRGVDEVRRGPERGVVIPFTGRGRRHSPLTGQEAMTALSPLRVTDWWLRSTCLEGQGCHSRGASICDHAGRTQPESQPARPLGAGLGTSW
jgi:hypothetical protein